MFRIRHTSTAALIAGQHRKTGRIDIPERTRLIVRQPAEILSPRQDEGIIFDAMLQLLLQQHPKFFYENHAVTISMSNKFTGVLKTLHGLLTSGRGTRACRRRVPTLQSKCLNQNEILEQRCLLAAATPAISIADSSIIEGNSGTSAVFVDVSLSAASLVPVTVNFNTNNRLARAGFDYIGSAGTLTIPAGQLTGRLSLTVLGDITDEPNETFEVNLASPTNATLARSKASVTIQDDDLPPTVSVADVSILEGNVASVRFLLSQFSALPVTITSSTGNGTATESLDFIPFSGNIIIPGGTRSLLVNLPTLADTFDEATETFVLNLTAAINATIADNVAEISIQDNSPPEVSVSDVTVTETSVGKIVVTASVTLSSASSLPISVNFQTRSKSAAAGSDFRTIAGTVTIPAGSLSELITCEVLDDRLSELNETFEIVLSSPLNASLRKSVGTITINDNDPLPFLSIANATVNEGESGTNLVLSLSTASGRSITVDYVASRYTAQPGVDFLMPSGTVTIPAGQLSATIPIVTIEDTLDEPDESFRVTLSNPSGVQPGQFESIVTIVDDDGVQLPLFELSDLAYLGAFKVPSGQVGTSGFEFGGNAITFNPAGNSLFLASDVDRGLHVAEISIPSQLVLGGNVAQMNVASVLQPFTNLGSLLTTNAAGQTGTLAFDYENLNLGGLIVANGGLTGGVFTGYTGAEPENSRNTHFRTTGLNLASLTTSSIAGLLDIRRNTNVLDGRIRGGYMAEVPLEWRDYIGANYVTGAAAQNRIEFSSSGPALFGLDATNPQASSGISLVRYPHAFPLQWSDPSNTSPQPIFNGTSKIDGVSFVPGTRSVIFIGSNGLSSIGYGIGSLFNDTARPYSGFHSQNGNYKYQIWAYDIEDFAAVRNGTKTPWSVRPTSVVNFDLATPEPAKLIGGTAFDPATGRLYVSQKLAGPNSTPVIHVYKLGRSTSPSSFATVKTTANVAAPVPASTVFTTQAVRSATQTTFGRSNDTAAPSINNVSSVNSANARVVTAPTTARSSASSVVATTEIEFQASVAMVESSLIDNLFGSLDHELDLLRP